MTVVTTAIPEWTAQGFLPPLDSATSPSGRRSPYRVSLVDFVLRFGNTKSRLKIIAGLLDFRRALHAVGLTSGYQWMNGSFIENVEAVEGRSPRDIDLVTFFHAPDGENQESLREQSPRLFDPRTTKEDYHIDAYFVQLNTTAPESLVGQSTYWDNLWSHRRNGQWKGYLRIDLAPTDDQVARASLAPASDD